MNGTPDIRHILILDDDGDFRKLLKNRLGKMFDGIVLDEYDPVERGVPGDEFDWSRYDVLLLDYYLCIHGTTGLDILQGNRNNPVFPATIMLTGAGNEEVAVKALKAGVVDFIRKATLDKAELRTAILNAFTQHAARLERQQSITSQSIAFNKALFYRQLEYAPESGTARVLLLLRLDHGGRLQQEPGRMIGDAILRHVARRCMETFTRTGANPSITRISDNAIALIIDDPGSAEALGAGLQGVCDLLARSPYRQDDRQFDYTVSIGAVSLTGERKSGEQYLQLAAALSDGAGRKTGNTYQIRTGDGREAAAAVPAPDPEPGLDFSGMSAGSLALKRAFDEKRVIQTFKPVIALSSGETAGKEVYFLSLQHIGTDGSISTVEQIKRQIDTPPFSQFVDRWMLREGMARIIGSGRDNYLFIIPLGVASLANADFFEWIRVLLKQAGAQLPDRCLMLDIAARDYFSTRKQADALITYLKKFHGIRFALSDVQDGTALRDLVRRNPFDALVLTGEMIRETAGLIGEGAAGGSLLQQIKDAGARIIAGGIGDATMLTEVISLGVDYAAGVFIGDEVAQISESTYFESFEII